MPYIGYLIILLPEPLWRETGLLSLVSPLVSSQGACKQCHCQSNSRCCFRHFQCFYHCPRREGGGGGAMARLIFVPSYISLPPHQADIPHELANPYAHSRAHRLLCSHPNPTALHRLWLRLYLQARPPKNLLY